MLKTSKLLKGLQILFQMFAKPETIKKWKQFTQKSKIASTPKERLYLYFFIDFDLYLKGNGMKLDFRKKS